ncbi:hypothetical protein Tco_0349574 [Tanacetum coccineum]
MEGARERAYAIRDGILYAVVSSRMNQVNELKSAQVDGGDAATVVATAAGGGGFGYCSHGDEVVCGGVDDADGVRVAAVVQSDGGRDDDGIRLMKMGVVVGCGGGGGCDGGEGVESVVGVVDVTSSKAITPDLPTEEPDNSQHLNTIPKTEKSNVENLVPIPSESKGISDDICDVPFCDNDHFDAEIGLINSLLSRDISITSPKIDFLPEEFAGELDLIDPVLPGIDEDDFDEEEGEIDIDILQIDDEILREKLLNVNLLIDTIEALNLTPSIPFVLEYPSFSPIPVVDSEFLIEEVDTFLVLEDSIPPGIESDFDSEGDIIFPNDLLNDDPILEYERFTFDIEPDAPVINNFDELNEDECFDPGGGEIVFSPNVEDDDSFTFIIRTFLPFLTYPGRFL